MSKYTVILSDRCSENLLSHTEFLSRVSVPAAKQLRDEFEKAIDRLEENPFQFPIDEEIDVPNCPYRKALFAKRYKAIFLVEDNLVFIDAIADCREQLSRYF